MKLLERTRSQRVREKKSRTKVADDFRSHAERLDTTERSTAKNRMSKLPERELKSAGSRKSFHRPLTADRAGDYKDDPTAEDFMKIKAGKDTFSFPTPSPRLPPPRKSMTYQDSPLGLASNESSPHIGVALGSPTRAPQWARSYTADQISNRMPRQTDAMQTSASIAEILETPEQRPQLKKSKSAWKTLGGLFNRKPSKPALLDVVSDAQRLPENRPMLSKPLPQREPIIPSPSPPLSHVDPETISSHHARTPSLARGMARVEARAELDKASLIATVQSKVRRTPSMVTAHAARPSSPPAEHQSRGSEDMFRQPEVQKPTPRTLRLDIAFPNAELDRYSVMFEKQLGQKPSLLERRQSKAKSPNSIKRLDEALKIATPKMSDQLLKTIVPQRSATSPHLKPLPSLSIHVEKNETTTDRTRRDSKQAIAIPIYHRPRPLQRSKTAPLDSVSPLLSATALAREVQSVSPCSAPSPILGENSLPPTPTTATADDDMALIAHDAMPPVRRNVDNSEPSWDMVTSKAVKISSPGSSEHSRESEGRYLRIRSPEDLERQVVQVSIARQVSVSRARRQVQNAVITKQPLRPRVVELSKNRKSTLVLIESDG